MQFSIVTKKVFTYSHSRSLQLLYTVSGNKVKLNTRTEFEILEHLLKGGVEAGYIYSCILFTY